MSNVITGRQWILDTVESVWSSEVKVLHFEFYGYAVDTDVAVITDRNDRVVWTATGNADLSPIISQDIGWCDGMKLATLTAGGGKVAAYIQ